MHIDIDMAVKPRKVLVAIHQQLSVENTGIALMRVEYGHIVTCTFVASAQTNATSAKYS